ncbi:MAG TPA: histidine kinase dimerization/phospho-acceptor domain-containing protein, partial [Candidatus Binatia bacterium]|nr:histidine kinase dimerization/phospho-acceptor domain-containing protein [Candidatus Binatia bacterium]
VLFLIDAQFPSATAPHRPGVDYLIKPFNPYSLKQKVSGLLGGDRPADSEPPAPRGDRILRFLSPPFLPASVSQLARQFADSPFALLIVAEPGSGQEAVARAVHGVRGSSADWLSFHPGEAARFGERLQGREATLTAYFRDIDTIDFGAQSALLDALLDEHTAGRELRLISNARGDLLEQVYRGEFLDALYYRIATLVLRLPPLRERTADIAAIADEFAADCARRLGLDKPRFSPAALERMRNYLWFGNLDELESVVARTLAAHRKDLIDAPDVLLGNVPIAPSVERKTQRRGESPNGSFAREVARAPEPQSVSHGASIWSNGNSQELKLLIGELAHELKNPMVTVKTFSQLLADRFDDPAFRVRFQQTVNGDIQRMDDLLEALLAFSHFGPPDKERVLVYEQLRRLEEELLPDCIKKETALQWTKRNETAAVFVDKAQFLFAFKNILKAAAAQVKPKSEIQVDVEEGGGVAISYVRDAAAMAALAEYVGVPATPGDEAQPLRVMLAHILLERNGGVVRLEPSDAQTTRIFAELPAEKPKGDEAKP